jgi:hypothetical protein
MINLIIGFILGFSTIHVLSAQLKEIRALIIAIHDERKAAEPEPFVTRTNPAFTNENMPGQEGSSIVTPKSPQLVDWEEQEELRKMNLRPR